MDRCAGMSVCGWILDLFGMDKKNTVIGLALLLGAMFLYMQMMQDARQRQREAFEQQQQREQQAAEQPTADDADAAASEDEDTIQLVMGDEDEGASLGGPATDEAAAADSSDEPIDPDEPRLVQGKPDGDEPVGEKTREEEEPIAPLKNDLVEVYFTRYGGAISSVRLLDYRATVEEDSGPYVFNARGEKPALAISLMTRRGEIRQWAPVFEMVSNDGKTITFSAEPQEGVKIVRTYTLSEGIEGAEPYTITHTTRIENRSGTLLGEQDIYFNVGTAPPTDADPFGWSLRFAYSLGAKTDFVQLNDFREGGFLGFFEREPRDAITDNVPTSWAAVKNQFFVGILTPELGGEGVVAEPVRLEGDVNAQVKKGMREGITGNLVMKLSELPTGNAQSFNMSYYVGPKELPRLDDLPQGQAKVMDFGLLGILSTPLLYMLLWIAGIVGSFGVGIILTTLFIRLCLWPLTARAAKMSKKMAKLQEPMKELRERFKDNPEKMNREMMKLFQKYKVNPAAGCLPIFIQLPIFLAFYFMLRSASELRFEEFLWIADLSQPDLIAEVAGFPIRLLPLIMGVSMYYQMKMTPTTMDATQAAIFKMLPFIFLIFCYNFSSGLVLYWTTSNCISILQQFRTNHLRDKEDEVFEVQVEEEQEKIAKKKSSFKKPPKKARR